MSYHIKIDNLVGIEMIVKALSKHAEAERDVTKRFAYRDLAAGISKHTLYVDDETGNAATLEQIAETLSVTHPRPALSVVKH